MVTNFQTRISKDKIELQHMHVSRSVESTFGKCRVVKDDNLLKLF